MIASKHHQPGDRSSKAEKSPAANGSCAVLMRNCTEIVNGIPCLMSLHKHFSSNNFIALHIEFTQTRLQAAAKFATALPDAYRAESIVISPSSKHARPLARENDCTE